MTYAIRVLFSPVHCGALNNVTRHDITCSTRRPYVNNSPTCVLSRTNFISTE